MRAPGSPPVARLVWTRRERLKLVRRAAPQREIRASLATLVSRPLGDLFHVSTLYLRWVALAMAVAGERPAPSERADRVVMAEAATVSEEDAVGYSIELADELVERMARAYDEAVGEA